MQSKKWGDVTGEGQPEAVNAEEPASATQLL